MCGRVAIDRQSNELKSGESSGNHGVMAKTVYRNPSYVISQLVILGGIEFSVTFGCLLYAIYHYRDKKNNRSFQTVKILTFSGILSYLLCCIVQGFDIWYWNVYYNEYLPIQTLTWYTTWCLWSIGMMMTYSLFLNLIQTTFKTSALALSISTRYYLYILMSLYIFVWMIASILPLFIYIDIGGISVSRDRVFQIESALSLPIAVIDILLSVSMTYIFVSRLHHLVSTQIVDHYESIESIEMDNVQRGRWTARSRRTLSFLSDTHSKMIEISVKVAVLAITSLTSSVMLMVFRAISFFFAYRTVVDKVASMWIQIDVMISCVCLVLFIPSTQRAFDRLCCCCNWVVTKCMRRSLQRVDVLKKPLLSDSRENC